MEQEKKVIKTKFGDAKISTNGYYVITTNENGNQNKPLHRLIFEDFYQTKIPIDWVIHHNDMDKTNNEIWNLIPMTKSEHQTLHNKGNTHNLGHKRNLNSKIKVSKLNNKTGIFRVHKMKKEGCKQGFLFKYTYRNSKGEIKSVSSVDINKLKEKVTEKGLKWLILDENKAKLECGVKI